MEKSVNVVIRGLAFEQRDGYLPTPGKNSVGGCWKGFHVCMQHTCLAKLENVTRTASPTLTMA